MKPSKADILREYGPFPGVDHVAGVGFDGAHVWLAVGDRVTSGEFIVDDVLLCVNIAAMFQSSWQ